MIYHLEEELAGGVRQSVSMHNKLVEAKTAPIPDIDEPRKWSRWTDDVVRFYGKSRVFRITEIGATEGNH